MCAYEFVSRLFLSRRSRVCLTFLYMMPSVGNHTKLHKQKVGLNFSRITSASAAALKQLSVFLVAAAAATKTPNAAVAAVTVGVKSYLLEVYFFENKLNTVF